jgi:hypothetical protein
MVWEPILPSPDLVEQLQFAIEEAGDNLFEFFTMFNDDMDSWCRRVWDYEIYLEEYVDEVKEDSEEFWCAYWTVFADVEATETMCKYDLPSRDFKLTRLDCGSTALYDAVQLFFKKNSPRLPAIEPGHYVYLMSCGGCVKIGYSSNPEQRRRHLQGANPKKILLEYYKAFDTKAEAMGVEQSLLRAFADDRLHGEWVQTPLSTVWGLLEEGSVA